MNASATGQAPTNAAVDPRVHLRWDSDGQAVFHTADGDRFVKSVAGVVELIQAEEAKKAGQQRIEDAVSALFSVFDGWVARNRDRIKGAWFTEQDGTLLFLVVQAEEQYDPTLSESLHQLDERLSSDPSIAPLKVDTLAIPPWGEEPQATFLSRRLKLRHRLT